MRRARRPPPAFRGLTLVELVVVIAIIGVVAGVLGVFIVRPVEGYTAQVRRAELVDAAESALRRMQREIRRALPNSIRIVDEGNGNGRVLELLPTVDGGRYRENPPGNQSARLRFNAVDTDFDTIGSLLCTTDPAITGACSTYAAGGYRLVIYNLGQPGADAYAGTDVIAAASTVTVTSGAAADGTSDHIRLNPGFDFAWRSPDQRFFIVDAPVAYVCDRAAGTLTRYQGHPLTADQTAIDTDAELSALAPGARVADKVSGCTMTYAPGTPKRAGLVTIALTLTDPDSGERVRLLHQVHVDNVP
jgi:MSHA biogenesis protein MshO